MSILAQLWAPIPTSNSGKLSGSHSGSGAERARGPGRQVSVAMQRKGGVKRSHRALVQRREDTGSQLGAPVPAQTLDEVGKRAHGEGIPTVTSSHCFLPALGPSGKNLPCTQHSMQLVHSQT